MSQTKLTHALGDNINEKLLIGNHLGCFLEKLSRHIAQGSNGAGCFRRELKNDRHAACEGGWGKLRGEHGKKRVLTLQAKPLLVNGFVGANARSFLTLRVSRTRRRILNNRPQHDSFALPLADPGTPSVKSKWKELTLINKRIDLRPNGRRFRRAEVIVHHESAPMSSKLP